MKVKKFFVYNNISIVWQLIGCGLQFFHHCTLHLYKTKHYIFIPSASSQHTFPINTTAFISSTSSPPSLPISTSAFIPSASSQHTLSINTTGFISSTGNQPTQSMTTTAFISSGINQPTLDTHRTAVSSAVYQPTLSKHPAGNQPSLSIPATTLIPPSRTQPTWSNPTTVFVPPTMNQPVLSTATTDPATIAMFTEYGSGFLSEWLDSLVIPRNINNSQQVKDVWEVGTVNFPPLHNRTTRININRININRNIRSSNRLLESITDLYAVP